MANHAYAACEGADPVDFWSAFRSGVERALPRFGGLAVVVASGNDAIELALVDRAGIEIATAGFWVNDTLSVEWRHGPDHMLPWWFQETVAAVACRHAAEALGRPVVLTDDGIGDEMAPEFDQKYPRFNDWERAWLEPMQAAGGLKGTLAAVLGASIGWRPSYPDLRDILDRHPGEPENAQSGPRI